MGLPAALLRLPPPAMRRPMSSVCVAACVRAARATPSPCAGCWLAVALIEVVGRKPLQVGGLAAMTLLMLLMAFARVSSCAVGRREGAHVDGSARGRPHVLPRPPRVWRASGCMLSCLQPAPVAHTHLTR